MKRQAQDLSKWEVSVSEDKVKSSKQLRQTHDPSRKGKKELNTDNVQIESSIQKLTPQEEVKAQYSRHKSKRDTKSHNARQLAQSKSAA